MTRVSGMRAIPFAVAGLLSATMAATAQTMALELLGRDADRVSRRESAEPDGYADVHFRVKVKFPQPVDVRSITLRPAGDGDRPLDEPGYGTGKGWLLAIEKDGRRLNEGFTDRLAGPIEDATFDLYVGDNGTLDVGSRVLVEIALGDGSVFRRAFTLSPPANRLLGVWQVHCDPGSPEAFEPMTLSGRLWLDLNEDGSATGEIDGIPLTGTVAGDSIVAVGESELGRASVRGGIVRPRSRRGRLSASGWLEYQPVGARCGSGPWSTR